MAALCGCSAQVPHYIKADHPYTRKLYGNYDNIIEAAQGVLVHNGWKVQRVTNSSVYERSNEDGENTDNDVVIFTTIQRHWRLLYWSYTHLNIFVHPTGEGAQVDLRWAKVTPLLFKFTSTRNDRLANRLLDQMEEELAK